MCATRPGFLSVAPQFTVPDVVAAAVYYGKVLGFENLGSFKDPRNGLLRHGEAAPDDPSRLRLQPDGRS